MKPKQIGNRRGQAFFIELMLAIAGVIAMAGLVFIIGDWADRSMQWRWVSFDDTREDAGGKNPGSHFHGGKVLDGGLGGNLKVGGHINPMPQTMDTYGVVPCPVEAPLIQHSKDLRHDADVAMEEGAAPVFDQVAVDSKYAREYKDIADQVGDSAQEAYNLEQARDAACATGELVDICEPDTEVCNPDPLDPLAPPICEIIPGPCETFPAYDCSCMDLHLPGIQAVCDSPADGWTGGSWTGPDGLAWQVPPWEVVCDLTNGVVTETSCSEVLGYDSADGLYPELQVAAGDYSDKVEEDTMAILKLSSDIFGMLNEAEDSEVEMLDSCM